MAIIYCFTLWFFNVKPPTNKNEMNGHVTISDYQELTIAIIMSIFLLILFMTYTP